MAKKFEMKQVVEFKCKTRGAGGDDIVEGHDLAIEVWGEEACSDRNGGAKAFAYLWRRFGPPWHGSDNYKDLVAYYLTTPDPDVFLWLHPNGSGLKYAVGYIANVKIRDEMDAPIIKWEKDFENWWWKESQVKHPEWAGWKKWTKKRKEIAGHEYWEDRMKKTVIRKAEKEIGKFPRRPHVHLDGWKKAGPIVKRVNEALVAAMKELLRPVYVRDCPMNILGSCGESNDAAKRSIYAGYGMNKEKLDEMVAEDVAKYGKVED
jgi:hypothetical protein